MNVPPKGSNAFRLGAYFETLKVSQQPVPNLTARIAEGAYWVGGNTLVEFAGGNTAVMVPPGAGLAVWVLVALTSNAGVQLVYGVPAATSSPPAPAVPAGYIPLAYVYLVNGTTAVTNDMIFDERPLWCMQTSFVPLAGATMTGPLILNANPTAVMGAATKQYVDTQDALHPTFTDLNNGLLTKADVAGTPSDTFVLNNDWVGAPSTNVFFGVDRGSQPDTFIRWNEGTDVWELTNDGSTYSEILTSGSISGSYLPITGGTLTGPLLLAASPVVPLGAATKGYVDTAIAGIGTTYVDVAGDTMTGVLVHPAGTAAVPAITFVGDLDTGFYSSGANEVSIAIGGAQKVRVNSTGITVFSGFFTPGTGTAAAPEFAFTNDLTTGLYRAAAGEVGVASAGVNVATFSATGMTVVGDISATTVTASGGFTISADLDMDGFKVSNLGTPTVGTDATTKTYVDTADGTKVNKTDTFALTGDVTVPATALTGPANSYAATIASHAVTAAKFRQSAANSLVGNPTGALADVADVTLGATLAFNLGVLQTNAFTGDVTTSANSFATTLANTAVTGGSYGGAGSVATFTVDSKGRLTAAATVAIAISGSQVSAGAVGNLLSTDGSGFIANAGVAVANLFLADGSVVATGNFDLDGHNVNNVNTINGSAVDPVSITGGAGVTANGNAVVITGGLGASGFDGGVVQLVGGTSVSGTGGGIEILGGVAGGAGQNGGNVEVTAGAATTVGTAGSVTVAAGQSPSGINGVVQLQTDGTDAVVVDDTQAVFSRIPVLPSYLTTGLPPAAGNVGGVIFVSDANTGSGAIAFSNGGNWIDPSTGIPVAI